MSLRLGQISMPITESITQSMELNNTGVIIIQHGVQDAVELALKLQNNSKANVLFLPKPFSQHQNDLQNGIEQGLQIINPGYSYQNGLEKESFLEGVIQNFHNPNGNILIEVGGISASTMSDDSIASLKGIVEITTFGHNRHLRRSTNTITPTYSIARSAVKESEARHVGLAVYRSIDSVLHELHRDITDTNVTMVGYGMIGQNVVKAFHGRSKEINVYDTDIEKVYQAGGDGFYASHDYQELIKNSDIIIVSTGQNMPAISRDFIEYCKDGVLLVSAGSRQNEIDVNFLVKNSEISPIYIHPMIMQYRIHGKDVFLFREGKNANFAGNSCPNNSMDLIHAETLYCVRHILSGKYNQSLPINETNKEEQREILNLYRHHWQ